MNTFRKNGTKWYKVWHLHISTTGYSGVLLRSLSLSLSLSSLMGRQEPSVKYSISSMSSLVSFRISDSSLKYTLLVRVPSQNRFHTKKWKEYLIAEAMPPGVQATNCFLDVFVCFLAEFCRLCHSASTKYKSWPITLWKIIVHLLKSKIFML